MFSPPPGWRLSVSEVFKYYEQLTADTSMPVMLYNIPADVATNLAPTTIAALADLPNVVAVKESNRDDRLLFETARLAGDRIRVFGNLLTRPGLGLMAKQWGADGYIGGGMLLGRDMARAIEAVWAGDLDTALAIVDRLEDLQTSLNADDGNGLFAGIPGQLKAILNLIGQPAGSPRFPRGAVTDGKHGLDALRKVLGDHGLKTVK
jgi:4-hydroxy-tetrahydrodipicolinate synthase